MNWFAWITELGRDMRFALRDLAKHPGFTAIAAGSLALGIGASTAMYSVIYAVILDPFPYKDVDQLMSIEVRDPARERGQLYYTVDQYLEFAGRNTIFDGVIASTVSDVVWTGSGDPVRLRGNHVTMNTFSVMGVPPFVGRTILPSDAEGGAEPIAILGYKFWQRQFGGDSSVIGTKLQLNGKIRTVVGIMPPRFMWRGADVYLPVVFHRGEITEGVRFVHVLGRLKSGITASHAEADLRPIVEQLKREDPRALPDQWRVGLRSFKESFPSGIGKALWILFGAVGLLLLIACVNVSNLLLAKAASRQREIAVRASLGASRARLIRQFLAESLVLSTAGAVFGIVIAYAGLKGIIAMVPPNTIPDESKVELNVAVLLFTMTVAIASAILSGLAPALHASRKDIAVPLKEAGRGTVASGQKVVRSALVVCEVALSLMLLVGASLMIRTLIALQNLDLGIRPDRLLTMRVPLSDARYADTNRRVAFLTDLLRRVSTVPGVVGAAVNNGFHPFAGFGVQVEVPGNAQQDNRVVLVNEINAEYPAVMGIGLAAGRLFTAPEVANRSHVAMVNRAFVKRYSAASSVIGRIVSIPRLSRPPASLADTSFQVVGVVNDALNRISTMETYPEIYVPYTILGGAQNLIAAVQGKPTSLANAIRAQVYQVDKDQPVTGVSTIEMSLNDWVYAGPRFNLLLFAVFAGLGMTLALAGVYGVISSLVTQRTPEIGVRIALGASFAQVIAMILKSGLILVGAGIALGLVGTLASVRVLSSQVSKVSTFDPVSFMAVAALLLVAGLFASFWPARRAAKVNPVQALRSE